MDETKQITILILDDEPIVCKRLKSALERKGYHVETFSKSSEAVARIREKTFEIVITDLKMEGIDGMQFLTEVKQRSPKTEVIVITGFATMETAKESFRKGVLDFLAKPFKLGEIFRVIEKAEKKIQQTNQEVSE